MSSTPLSLPPRGFLRPTSNVDYIEHYYGGGLAFALRQRLKWARDALPREGCTRLLEIGYGSGVFFYETVRHAKLVLGLDIHPYGADVRRRCAEAGVGVTPVQGDACALPFADSSVDVIMMISALEFMPDPLGCLHESLRLLRPSGRIIALTPRVHTWSDRLWHILGGGRPEDEFRGGRQRVELAFAVAERRRVGIVVEHHPRPRPLPRGLAPYDLVVMRKG